MPDGMNYLPKPDVLSVRSLRDWLRQQDGATEYDYWNLERCPIGCLLEAHGIPNDHQHYDAARLDFEEKAMNIVYPTPWTYAAALSRCNDYLSNTEGRDGEA